jgi:hypothetical protein
MVTGHKGGDGPDDASFTLEQLCRALAAHCLLTAHPGLLHEFLAPETAERTAQFILRFALGEPLRRPLLDEDGS